MLTLRLSVCICIQLSTCARANDLQVSRKQSAAERIRPEHKRSTPNEYLFYCSTAVLLCLQTAYFKRHLRITCTLQYAQQPIVFGVPGVAPINVYLFLSNAVAGFISYPPFVSYCSITPCFITRTTPSRRPGNLTVVHLRRCTTQWYSLSRLIYFSVHG